MIISKANLLFLSFMGSMVVPALSENPLVISAFNIRTFGKSKMSDPVKAARIAKITSRYDVMLLQEIRDASGKSLRQLMRMLKEYGNYSMVLSERLGRSSYKEQYAFIYRTNRVQILDSYQFDDGVDNGTDVFEREPFSVLVHPVNSCTEFALIALHSKPTEAVSEITALDGVRKSVETKWNTKNIMILGDLNADCSYATKSTLSRSNIYSDSSYKWLIDWNVDTTTSSTNCAYDRIISRGQELDDALVKDSPQVYLFDISMNLSASEAYALSDHYPVELQLNFQTLCDPCSSRTKTCTSQQSPQTFCSCKNGRPRKQRCSQTQLWDEQKQMCQAICQPFQTALIPHTTCGKYVYCVWGFPIVLDCPNYPHSSCINPC